MSISPVNILFDVFNESLKLKIKTILIISQLFAMNITGKNGFEKLIEP